MKVFIHVEEIFPRVPVYHVGVGYKWGPLRFRYDYPSKKVTPIRFRGRKRTISIGNSTKNIFEIHRFQRSLQDQRYVLGFSDCRHFSQRLLDFSCDSYTDVVNMFNLYKYQ